MRDPKTAGVTSIVTIFELYIFAVSELIAK